MADYLEATCNFEDYTTAGGPWYVGTAFVATNIQPLRTSRGRCDLIYLHDNYGVLMVVGNPSLGELTHITCLTDTEDTRAITCHSSDAGVVLHFAVDFISELAIRTCPTECLD